MYIPHTHPRGERMTASMPYPVFFVCTNFCRSNVFRYRVTKLRAQAQHSDTAVPASLYAEAVRDNVREGQAWFSKILVRLFPAALSQGTCLVIPACICRPYQFSCGAVYILCVTPWSVGRHDNDVDVLCPSVSCVHT